MLVTDWVKVGTAGKTIDGREITHDMLTRAGERYSPALYTATINSEHFFFPGLGHVAEVEARPDAEGRMALWCKLAPTAEFFARNQNKRQLFYSMELTKDFPGEKDWYLSGLAITDIPASQGLAPQLFSADKGEAERFYNTAAMERAEEGSLWMEKDPEAIKPGNPPPEGETPNEGAPGWAKNLLASIKTLLAGAATSTDSEEEPMTPEEKTSFEALKKRVGELSLLPEQVTKLTEAVSGLAEQFKAGAGDPKPKDKDADKAEFAAAIEGLKAELGDKFTEFEKFMAETRETEALEVTAPGAGQDDDANKWV